MPEGDSVFKLAGYLHRELCGRELVGGSVRGRADLTLAGSRLGEVYPQGKHLFIELDQELMLRSHLGVRGSWHGYACGETWQKPARQASIVLDIGERVFVCFNALQVEVLRAGGIRHRQFLAELGPDLIDAMPDFVQIVGRARRLMVGGKPIADALLDQGIACGIGNVYKSEVLFLEGYHPATRLGQLSDASVLALYRRAHALLRRNLRGGMRMTRWANDDAGDLWVYRRAGHPCLQCSSVIRSMRLGVQQRATFWCPTCQPEPAGYPDHPAFD